LPWAHPERVLDADARNGPLRALAELDVGMRLVVARRPPVSRVARTGNARS
jgi:hypothetical protein